MSLSGARSPRHRAMALYPHRLPSLAQRRHPRVRSNRWLDAMLLL